MNYDSDQLRTSILDNLDLLTPIERKVIKLRFGFDGEQPHTLMAAGKALNITPERVRQIQNLVMIKLRKVYIHHVSDQVDVIQSTLEPTTIKPYFNIRKCCESDACKNLYRQLRELSLPWIKTIRSEHNVRVVDWEGSLKSLAVGTRLKIIPAWRCALVIYGSRFMFLLSGTYTKSRTVQRMIDDAKKTHGVKEFLGCVRISSDMLASNVDIVKIYAEILTTLNVKFDRNECYDAWYKSRRHRHIENEESEAVVSVKMNVHSSYYKDVLVRRKKEKKVMLDILNECISRFDNDIHIDASERYIVLYLLTPNIERVSLVYAHKSVYISNAEWAMISHCFGAPKMKVDYTCDLDTTISQSDIDINVSIIKRCLIDANADPIENFKPTKESIK